MNNSSEKINVSILRHIGYHENTRRCERCAYSYEDRQIVDDFDKTCAVVGRLKKLRVNDDGMCKLFRRNPLKVKK